MLTGSWDDCPYAVLIPVDDIPPEQIGSAAPMDLFTKGSIELTENTWILCPAKEIERLKVFNPKANILGYEGEKVLGFAQAFLTHLGYHSEQCSSWSWSDEKSVAEYAKLMEEKGFDLTPHSMTSFSRDEEAFTQINHAVALSKLLRDHNLLTKTEDIENIMNQVGNEFNGLGGCLREGNCQYTDVFLEEMKKNGFHISHVYQDIMKAFGAIHPKDYGQIDIGAICNIHKEMTGEEMKTIADLQAKLGTSKLSAKYKPEEFFSTFIKTAILESIVHSQERDISKETSQEEQVL